AAKYALPVPRGEGAPSVLFAKVPAAIAAGTLANNTLGAPSPRGTGNAYFAADGVTPIDGNYNNLGRWSLMRLTDQNRFLLDQGWKTMRDVVPTNAAGQYDPNGDYYDLIYEDFSY